MPEVKWSAELSVGIAEIDEQHQHFLELINLMHRATRAGKGKAALAPALDELADYTRTHFATEEQLMFSHGFPGYVEHKALHEAMVLRVKALQRRFASGDTAITLELMGTLAEWLVKHIQTADKQYAEFLRARNVD